MKLTLVPARTGATWVKLGLQTFVKQPLAMAGLFFMFMAVMSLLPAVPWIGLPLGMVLLPSMTLGVMEGTRQAASGKFPMPLVLLTAFRSGQEKRRALLILGGLYAASLLLAMGTSYLVDGGEFAGVYLGRTTVTQEMMTSSSFVAAMWTFLGLHLPLSLLFWHSPALVYWQGIPVGKSMFFSIVACWRNLRAMLVFGATWVLVMLGVVLLPTLVLLLMGATTLATALMFPLLLAVGAMFFTSLYFTYRDTFEATDLATVAHTDAAD